MISDLDDTALYLVTAEPDNGDDGKVHDDHHHRTHERKDILHAERNGEKVVVGVMETLGFVVLADVCLDHARTRYVFLHDGVDAVQTLLHTLKERLCFFHHAPNDEKLNGERNEDNDCKFGVQRDRHDDTAHEHDRRTEKDSERLCNEGLHHGNVVRHTGNE